MEQVHSSSSETSNTKSSKIVEELSSSDGRSSAERTSDVLGRGSSEEQTAKPLNVTQLLCSNLTQHTRCDVTCRTQQVVGRESFGCVRQSFITFILWLEWNGPSPFAIRTVFRCFSSVRVHWLCIVFLFFFWRSLAIFTSFCSTCCLSFLHGRRHHRCLYRAHGGSSFLAILRAMRFFFTSCFLYFSHVPPRHHGPLFSSG